MNKQQEKFRKKSSKNKNTGKIILLVGYGLLLAAALAFLVMIIISGKSDRKDSDNKKTYTHVYKGPDEVTDTDRISAKFIGDELYAGGQAVSGDFQVELVHDDGTSYELTEYTCDMFDEGKRLDEGSNNFTFGYGTLTTTITVDAVNPKDYVYPPSYVLNKVDNLAAAEKVAELENGTLSYEDVFSEVVFTGDSQIKALATNGIFTMDRIVAEVGESYDYLEANFDSVVNMALGSDVLVVHYGINTLNASADDRAQRIEQYKDLLLRLKEKLPHVRIIVSGVFPVSDTILSSQERYAYIEEYDFMILEMCMEIGVEYLSDNEYMVQHQEVFSKDGIHLTKEFYTEYWLKNLILTMGI